MLGRDARAGVGRAFTPAARLLVRWRITPDLITWTGTALTCVLAVVLLVPGHLIAGALAITVVVLLDSLDGLVARMTGSSSRWGAFLDSTLDRLADGVVLGALAVHCLAVTARTPLTVAAGVLAITGIVLGALISYAKARAQSLGMDADVGLMERADRFVVILAGALVAGFVGPAALVVSLGILVAGSAWTVVQRMLAVHRQDSLDREAGARGSGAHDSMGADTAAGSSRRPS